MVISSNHRKETFGGSERFLNTEVKEVKNKLIYKIRTINKISGLACVEGFWTVEVGPASYEIILNKSTNQVSIVKNSEEKHLAILYDEKRECFVNYTPNFDPSLKELIKVLFE